MSGGSVIKSGFLLIELDGKYVTQFVELSSNSLQYFDKKKSGSFFFKESKRDPNGHLVIDYHAHVTNRATSNGDNLGFTINRDGKTLKFMTASNQEKKAWVDTIMGVINEEEVDSQCPSTPPRTPGCTPAVPIATPSSRKTYKSYLKDYLEMSDAQNGPWKKVWFILSMEALTYYKSSSATDRIGSVAISDSTEVHTSEEVDDLIGSVFIFRVENKQYASQSVCIGLRATSEEIRLRWMNAIHSVKKMSLCRAEGDLATMWKWESHLKDTMCVESMPKNPDLKIRSASIFGFRPGSTDSSEGSDDDFFPAALNKGFSQVFNSIESGAQSTVSGISRGIDSLDDGRKFVQGTLMDGTGALIDSIDTGIKFIPLFDDDGKEDYEARSDSFCEYEEDDECEDEEDGGEGEGGTWKNSKPKNVTVELNSKLAAVATVVGALALLLILFIAHSAIFDLGHLMVAVECCTFGFLVFMSYQQVLGYLCGIAFRYKLTKSIHGDGTKFGLYFEAIKLNIGMDLCELEIRGLRWMNPDKFKSSYGETFLKVKTIRVMVPTLSLYYVLIERKKALKIDQFFVDGALVTLAQAGTEKVQEYNVLSAVGQSDDSTDADDNTERPPSSQKTDNPKQTPFRFELNSFVLINLKVRLRNIFKVKSNDLTVPHVVMTREALTAKPHRSTEHRLPLSAPDLLSVIAKEVGTELVAENKVAMLAILSSSGARHLIALFDPRNLAKLMS